MRLFSFKVPLIGDVRITLAQVESKDDLNATLSLMKKNGVEDPYDFTRVSDNITYERTNGGDTFSYIFSRRILVIFYPFTNEMERETIFGHEKRHCEDRILEAFRINDMETAGLLAGYLSRLFFQFKQTYRV